ncbi:hypothetical protein ABF87_04285 [Nitrosomonas sp. JL21]|uniref:hypothetical protein n=1 Tax=Nitrosomonas sp. JL21 TaxID=153949 RepID=UPI001368A22B|nr:hypothetical protein [Nitrosomonas sp. JL21]MBL8497322.1 hypothetical protein [Nitrosomonas sp.]MXS77191.1 hypothetical protein [Nitrosomonas sp. JL21]
MKKIKTKEYSSAGTWLKSLTDEDRKKITRLYEDNLHHIKAKDILKDAIHKAIDNPEMTPGVKEIGEMFIYMLLSCGESFDYTFDGAAKEIVDIARVEIPSAGGKARAENDEKTDYLKEIEKEAKARAEQFNRYGYKADFVREMLKKYPKLKDDKAINTRLGQLAKNGKIGRWQKK